jgi:nucleoside-diphosphate-sugar epimerase
MKTLVTGGGGFLGGVIVRMLRERGDQVVSISRSSYPALTALGVAQVQADLTDKAAVINVAEGCDSIFHVAAKAGIWGSYNDFYQANVTGTEHVLEACRVHGITKLVYTSSPSVVFDGSDVENGDESLPYPRHYEAHYPKTKALAEQLVVAANGPMLATVALRPHLIWGPGDNHLVPRIITKGKSGKLRKIGNRPCLVDTVYVDNAARAHLQAADNLKPGSPVAGKAYFISNGEPIPLWEMVNLILAAAGIAPVTASISRNTAYTMGILCEGFWRLFKLPGEPPMTRFVAKELATAHWFNINAARKDFGYHPEVSLDAGMKHLKQWLDSIK